MNNTTICTLICCLAFQFSQAQNTFEPGYYIDDQNNRKEVFIKNIDWLDNPSKFAFKGSLTENEQQTLTISDVNEFGIGDHLVFKRFNVLLDMSSSNINRLSTSREPEFEEKQLFLKKIVSGKASLFYYSGNSVQRYFYTLDNDTPKPLIFKKYQVGSTKVGVNESYKQEIKSNLSCTNANDRTFEKLKYNTESLSRIIAAFNECEGSASIHYDKPRTLKTNNNVKIKAFAGMRINDLAVVSNNLKFEFNPRSGVQIGLAGEYILNFNNNKWSIIASAIYFAHKDEPSLEVESDNRDYILDYSAIELAAGGRHSIFITNDSRITLSAYYVVPLNLNQSLKSASGVFNSYDEFETFANFGAGLGFEYKKLSVEFNMVAPRSLINGISSKYSSLSFSLGYSFN